MRSKIDYEEINRILQLLEEKKLSHFELEVEGFKIKISRNSPPSPAIHAPSQGAASTPSSQGGEGENPGAAHTRILESQNNLYFITAPMVGIFYRAPDPNSPSFVEIGESVKKKQTLCIIEAMKLMNELESDMDGIIKEIYVENGKPIEYGQKLFAILPTS
ncbi:MAG: acetyl-CoA carboxylase biotin carboxyl carrier protein [Candidatus Aminicenantales bacterium]